MKSWKDIASAAIGLTMLTLGFIYVFVFVKPLGHQNGIMHATETPVHLLPSCDYYPKGLNGEPCVDGD